MTPGIVYLVGAGPGDPELITLRGARCLVQADVIVYDRLVNPALLDLARPEAERVFVGKTLKKPSMPQEAINQLLVDRAREGKVVIRLKGGDPFVFGRGGEEALALAHEGVPFEVVPGVTAAVAVPAVVGIPITQRGVSRSFAVVTGHTCDGGLPNLPTADTLVVLMGVSPLKQIVTVLLTKGRPAATPAAVITEGTTPRQQIVTGTLADIGERANGLEPPAVLVVGEVVRLREALAASPSP